MQHQSGCASVPRSRAVPLLAALLISLAVAACSESSTPLAPEDALSARHGASAGAALVPASLGALRGATAAYHRLEAAIEAGWDTQLTGCFEMPGLGGMGIHIGNLEYMDGRMTLHEPQVLVYEPMKNGRLRLGAVEYIVPFDFAPADGPAPTLLGHEYEAIPGVGWALHVWIWKHNPAGMFAAWNPAVTCDYEDAWPGMP